MQWAHLQPLHWVNEGDGNDEQAEGQYNDSKETERSMASSEATDIAIDVPALYAWCCVFAWEGRVKQLLQVLNRCVPTCVWDMLTALSAGTMKKTTYAHNLNSQAHSLLIFQVGLDSWVWTWMCAPHECTWASLSTTNHATDHEASWKYTWKLISSYKLENVCFVLRQA